MSIKKMKLLLVEASISVCQGLYTQESPLSSLENGSLQQSTTSHSGYSTLWAIQNHQMIIEFETIKWNDIDITQMICTVREPVVCELVSLSKLECIYKTISCILSEKLNWAKRELLMTRHKTVKGGYHGIAYETSETRNRVTLFTKMLTDFVT